MTSNVFIGDNGSIMLPYQNVDFVSTESTYSYGAVLNITLKSGKVFCLKDFSERNRFVKEFQEWVDNGEKHEA